MIELMIELCGSRISTSTILVTDVRFFALGFSFRIGWLNWGLWLLRLVEIVTPSWVMNGGESERKWSWNQLNGELHFAHFCHHFYLLLLFCFSSFSF